MECNSNIQNKFKLNYSTTRYLLWNMKEITFLSTSCKTFCRQRLQNIFCCEKLVSSECIAPNISKKVPRIVVVNLEWRIGNTATKKLDKDLLLVVSGDSFLGQVNHLLHVAVSSRTFIVVSNDSFFTVKKKGSALIEGLVLFWWNVNR